MDEFDMMQEERLWPTVEEPQEEETFYYGGEPITDPDFEVDWTDEEDIERAR